MKYFITAGLGGGFRGSREYMVEDFDSEQKALDWAYKKSREHYEVYEGNYGIRDVDQIMEEDEVDEDEAREIYEEEMESWLDYSVTIYNPELHDGYLN